MKPALVLICASALFLSACCQPGNQISLSSVSFKDLSGWEKDSPSQAIPAFLRSCDVFEKRSQESKFKLKEAGQIKDWLVPCAQAKKLPHDDDQQARAFFENYFIPYEVNNKKSGLFTGYFEVELNGSLTRHGAYQTPIWELPPDLIIADLGEFREELKGKKIIGKIEKAKFIPYDNRSQIAQGALENRAMPLLWTDDPVAAFFLEIQGSGRVQLDSGKEIQVGYAAQNGHLYTPIGRVLLEKGEIEKPVSMAKIKDWFARNPTRRQEIMNENASTIFFRRVEGDGPIGAMNIALTPLRSMAVDARYVPLGIPLWFSSEQHQRLLVAQDTGGAIKGQVRGDLFWGSGQKAEKGAGEMQESGTYYLLLPRKVETP